MTSTIKLLDATAIFLIGLVIFTIGLDSREIISFDSRFYLFALEMWRHGPSWFATTYLQPYPDYPGTSTFLIYIFSKLMGGVSKFTAVFPSAVAAAITLVITYLIGVLHSRIWGISAVLFLLFTIGFFIEARTISLDQYVTAVTASCFYLVYSAQLLQKPRRVPWTYLLFVVGFLFRGPLGLVIPTGVVCVFYLLEKNFKQLITVAIIAAILLIICSTVLLMLAYSTGGTSFLHNVLQAEVFGRLQDSQTPPIYFYFTRSFGAYAITYPLAIFVLIGLFETLSFSEKSKILLKFLGWVLIILIGLSIPADKKIRYILPMAPALALICGYLFAVAQEQKYYVFLRRAFKWFCILFPFFCALIIYVLYLRYPNLVHFYTHIMISLLIIQILMFVLMRHEYAVFVLAVFVFVNLMLFVNEPFNLGLNQTRNFVKKVESLRQQANATLVFYQESKDGLPIKYLVNAPQEINPVFVNSTDELLKLKKPVIVIIREENYGRLPARFPAKILMRGRLGHAPVVVLEE